MRILITGATGFIGSALAAALAHRGHTIVKGVHRGTREENILAVDYTHDLNATDWLPRLQGVDAVINAVGILRESKQASFDALHHRAPAALFQACATAGVKRVIQISALGADENARSSYHLSKKKSDDILRQLNLNWTILQPSIVFGMGGASTRLFLGQASMPVTPLVGHGEQTLQPIHIDDLTELVIRLLENESGIRQTIHAVGPSPITLREMLASYRAQLGFGTPHFVMTPMPLIQLAARLGDVLKMGALSTETLAMLQRGNTGDAQNISQVLGQLPRPLSQFICKPESLAWRAHAILFWLKPLLQSSLSAMWISAGLLSALFAQQLGLDLLMRLGLNAPTAKIAFASACLLDVALGIACLRPSRALWFLQLAVIVFYTAALSMSAPGLWLDPFGPLVKNIPLVALILGLIALEGGK